MSGRAENEISVKVHVESNALIMLNAIIHCFIVSKINQHIMSLWQNKSFDKLEFCVITKKMKEF